jgi:hypothetical protein
MESTHPAHARVRVKARLFWLPALSKSRQPRNVSSVVGIAE